MISRTAPEPQKDIDAQLRALADASHPKDAVWLAAGNEIPPVLHASITRVSHSFGTLLTTDPEKARQFIVAPSDDTLAAILGYVEPKSLITWPAFVVQARDEDNAVVHEMLVSSDKVNEAISKAEPYGIPHVMTLPDAMERRLLLWIEENQCR